MSVYGQYEPPQSEGGLFLKLKDGEAAKLRFAGEPYIFYNNYKGSISTRYAWVVWNQDKREAQIFQQGVTGYRAIAALATDTDWGDPKSYDVKVTREGEGKETRYHFTPSPNKTPLPQEQLDKIKEIDVAKAIKGSILLAKVVGGADIPPAEDTTTEADLPPTSNYEGQPETDEAPW